MNRKGLPDGPEYDAVHQMFEREAELADIDACLRTYAQVSTWAQMNKNGVGYLNEPKGKIALLGHASGCVKLAEDNLAWFTDAGKKKSLQRAWIDRLPNKMTENESKLEKSAEAKWQKATAKVCDRFGKSKDLEGQAQLLQCNMAFTTFRAKHLLEVRMNRVNLRPLKDVTTPEASFSLDSFGGKANLLGAKGEKHCVGNDCVSMKEFQGYAEDVCKLPGSFYDTLSSPPEDADECKGRILQTIRNQVIEMLPGEIKNE